MRRLSILFATFLLAWFATGFIANAAEPAAFVLRDGLLLAGVAAVVFALNATFGRLGDYEIERLEGNSSDLPIPQSLNLQSLVSGLRSLPLPTLVFLLAIALRLWRLSGLPADCVGDECTRALGLEEGTTAAGLLGWLAQLFWGMTEDGLFSLRLAGGLVGSLSVMSFYGLARQIVTPMAALLGTLLLAISPWSIWASRSADPALVAALALTLLLWALAALINRRTRLRWGALALATLYLGYELRSFTLPAFTTLFFGFGQIPGSHDTLSPNLPISDLQSLVTIFLHSNLNVLGTPFTTAPLLNPLLSALAILGLVLAISNLRQPGAALTFGALVVVTGLVYWLVPTAITLNATILLLPVILLCATLATDQLITGLLTTWRLLIQPATLIPVALIVLLLAGGRATWAMFGQLDEVRTVTSDATNGTMARYLRQTSEVEPDTIFFVPPALLLDPGARLVAGELLQSPRVQLIDPSALPYTGPASGDLAYLLPGDQSALFTLLQQVYPAAILQEQQSDDKSNSFISVRVLASNITASQPLPPVGLFATYYAGTQPDGIVTTQRVEPLPGYPVDLPQPYSVSWLGKVAAVRSGEYLFGTLTDGTATLSINSIEVVTTQPPADPSQEDTAQEETLLSQQLHEGMIYLEAGWHIIEVRYTPKDALSTLQLFWQVPGSTPMPLVNNFLQPNADVMSQPPLPINELPLADERLGTSDGFALTSSVDLWQSQVQTPIGGLSPLVVESVWTVANSCGGAETQFNNPHGIAIDATSGRIFIADTGNRRIVVLSLSGQLQTIYTANPFEELVDLALEPGGSLLALDAVGAPLTRLDQATGVGTPLALSTSFYRPRGFAVDPLSGMILVADTGGARVVILDPAGQMLGEFGGRDKALGTGQPVDTAALNNQWWAASAENGRIWQISTLGSLGALQPTNTLNGPQMASHPNGSLFVSDPGLRRILLLAPTGQPRRQFEGGFAEPTGVATAVIDGQTYLAVADTQSCALSLWRVLEM